MAQLPRTISATNLLVVEGDEEICFWEAVLRGNGRSDYQVLSAGGKHDLRNKLPLIAKTPGFDSVARLGVVQDADENPGAAFDRICGALRKASLPVPARPWAAKPGSPSVVAFVLPDGGDWGDLEALVWRTLGPDSITSCVESFFDSLSQIDGYTLPRQIWKARVHAYLATLPRPDHRLGEAAVAGLLPLSSPYLTNLVDTFLPSIDPSVHH